MTSIIRYIPVLLLLLFISAGCKKDSGASGTKAVFSFVVDGFKVSFTNFSTNANQCSWDFGDGSDSSSKLNPMHVFPEKGQYLVTLKIWNGQETSSFADTVLITGPSIKIDGDFSDWANVPFSHENAAGIGGTIRAVKTFAGPDNINFYVEGTTGMNLEVMDLYINADNNPATGYSIWFYPVGSGADILCEGNYNLDNPNLTEGSVFRHAGLPTEFSWNTIYKFSDVMKFSKMTEKDGARTLEFSIQRKALGTISNYIHFGLLDNSATFSEMGSIPATQLSTSGFSPIKL